MASLWAMGFLAETPCEIAAPLQRGRRCRVRDDAAVSAFFPHPKYATRELWPRRSRGEGVGGFAWFPRGRTGRCVWAMGKRRLTKAEGSAGDDAVGLDASDDALKATIEKKKKVSDMQNNLLKQIAERRKILSSIKDSVDKGMDAISSSVADGSLPGSDPAMKTGVFVGEQDVELTSDIYSQTTSTKIPEISAVGGNGKYMDGESQFFDKSQIESSVPNATSLQMENSVANALGLSRETESATSDSLVMPAALPEVSEPENVQAKELEKLLETTIQDEGNEQDVVSDEGDTSLPLAGENVMNVILVSVECAPWSKTGGLGDVAGGLPKALARRGHRVMVVSPRYGNYAEPREVGVRKIYNIEGQDMEVNYYHAFIDGVDFVFMESPIFRNWNNNIYGGGRMDILKRMVLLCKAAVEVPWHVSCGETCYGDGNLVFIANDWHAALLPVYLKAYYRDNGLMTYTRSVLVIHNIAHQGRGPVDDFKYLALPDSYLDLFKLYDPVGGEHCNIFAAGLKTADRVVTVSHSYAWELKTSEGGWGLHQIIGENDWKLRGIVNGIDLKEWNPEVDVHLKSDGYTNYSLDTFQSGKPQCKAALQRELGLPMRNDVPLVGFIGRLDYQKGIDLIEQAIPWMSGQDMQLVMLGTGREDLEEMLERLQSQYHNKIRACVVFSAKMAHRITAGADILLMPSRFEPCGLNQLYAMKYGTVPVVHAVGGLRDTVVPYDPCNNSGYGWTFDRMEANKLVNAMGNCLNTYWNHKGSWEGLQRRGMMQDHSWDNAAQIYEEVLVEAKYQW